MLGRQIKSLEKKALQEKALPQKEMIKRGWRAAELRERRFWNLTKERFGIEKDEKGLIRKNRDK